MDGYLSRALAEIERTAAPLDVETIGRRVDGRWSPCDILEHLTLAFDANAATFEKALASGTLKVRRPSLAERVARVLVIDVGYFPRVEAPEATRPRGSVTPERSVAALRDALIALDATMSRVAGRFGEDIPVTNHPFFAGLSLRQWRKFHWRHTVHHMRQVRRRAGKV